MHEWRLLPIIPKFDYTESDMKENRKDQPEVNNKSLGRNGTDRKTASPKQFKRALARVIEKRRSALERLAG